MNVFDKYADFYDVFYAQKDYLSESNFIIKLFEKYQLNNSDSILELGTGTGQHLKYISEKYPNFLGLEPSYSMRLKAMKLLGVDILSGNAEDLDISRNFKCIFSFFHVVSYIEDINRLFQTIASHLDEDGLFIFDCWNTTGVFYQKPEVRSQFYNLNNAIIHRISEPTISQHGDYIDVNYTVYSNDLINNKITKFDEKHRMYCYSYSDLKRIARFNGFEIVDTFDINSEAGSSWGNWQLGVCLRKIRV